MTIVCTMREAPTRVKIWGRAVYAHTTVGPGACAKLTMLEATRPGHLWLLLFCPADLAVPSVLYGSNRATHRLYANNVVMSSVESCFSRRPAQRRAETLQLMVNCTPDTAKADCIFDCSLPGRNQARRSFGSGGPRQGFFSCCTCRPGCMSVRNNFNLILHNIVTHLSLHARLEPY